LISGSYIQADETPVDVQTREGRGKNHQAYLWQYSRPVRSPGSVHLRSTWTPIRSSLERRCGRLQDQDADGRFAHHPHRKLVLLPPKQPPSFGCRPKLLSTATPVPG
jgi:hypothetical protein